MEGKLEGSLEGRVTQDAETDPKRREFHAERIRAENRQCKTNTYRRAPPYSLDEENEHQKNLRKTTLRFLHIGGESTGNCTCMKKT